MSIIIFCDGACLGNPGRGGWGSIVSVPSGETVELGGAEPETTNNRMEMTAVIEALKFLQQLGLRDEEVLVHSDSKYFVDGASKWMFGWAQRGWKTAEGQDVKNKDLWEKISNLASTAKSLQWRMRWIYVEGHAGIPGNERCDEIATQLASGAKVSLYNGSSRDYPIELSAPIVRSPKRKPYYLSLIGGEIFRDETWPACQARVQGRSGVKYKKVSSAAEELEILRQWGLRQKT